MRMNIKLIKQVHDTQKITYQTIGEDKLKVVIQDVEIEDVLQELYYSFDNIEIGKIYDLDEYVFSVNKDEEVVSLELIYFVQEDYVDEELDVDELVEQVKLESIEDVEFIRLRESVFSSFEENDAKQELEKANELLSKRINVLSEQLEFRDELIQELALMVYE